MTFNPPPGWPPMPPGWSPPSGWRPDPSWPPAPPGWSFWSDMPISDASQLPHGRSAAGSRTLGITVAVAAAVIVAILVVGFLLWPSPGAPVAAPVTVTNSVTVAPGPAYETLTDWEAVGGIDVRASNGSTGATLDTHDTTDTWVTKWSGLVRRSGDICGTTISAQIRDVSHRLGVPGGYGLGLTRPTGSHPANLLTGTAVQYDFGQRGYRLATYPSDGDFGLVPADLDNAWHDVELTVGSDQSISMRVDGKQVASRTSVGTCGRPTIRVWAGSIEVRNVTVR